MGVPSGNGSWRQRGGHGKVAALPNKSRCHAGAINMSATGALPSDLTSSATTRRRRRCCCQMRPLKRRDPKASQMKFRFLALGLLATTASVASAHVFVPLPARTAALARSTEQSQPPLMVLPTHVSALPARSAPSLDATRPPVPVLFAPRRSFVPAHEAASTPSPSAAATTPAGNMSEAAAKAAIEADGYKEVRALARGSDGVWKASALRGQTEVLLSVGPTGSVSAN